MHDEPPAVASFRRTRFRNLTASCVLTVLLIATADPFAERKGGPDSNQAAGQEPLASLETMVQAVNAGDASRYAAVYAPDAVITIHGTNVLKGRTAIEKHEVELLSQFPGARFGFSDVWCIGDTAVVRYAVSGRTPAGLAMGHEGLLVFTFNGSGLIQEERRYLDSLTPMTQMGLLGTRAARPRPEVAAAPTIQIARRVRRERDNVALVRASLGSLDQHDERAFLSNLADDIVIEEMIEPQRSAGRRDARTWFLSWTRAVRDMRTDIVSAFGAGDYVLMETIVRGALTGQLGPVSASDKAFAVHRGVVARVRDQRITRLWAFMNGRELAEAVGQWPLPTQR